MAIFLLMTGMAFYIPEDSKARIAVIALGIYLHCASGTSFRLPRSVVLTAHSFTGCAYSPGEGPVPYVSLSRALKLSNCTDPLSRSQVHLLVRSSLLCFAAWPPLTFLSLHSAEAFPLYVRGTSGRYQLGAVRRGTDTVLLSSSPLDVGMSFATATTWIFNFVRSYLSVPTHSKADAAPAGRRPHFPAPPRRIHAAGCLRLVRGLCVE